MTEKSLLFLSSNSLYKICGLYWEKIWVILLKIKSYVNNFFKNTIQRVLNKLKEYAKKGVQFLLDVLGIQVNGSSELTIKF